MWVLLCRVSLCVDSINDCYEVKQPLSFSFRLTLHKENILELSVFGVKVNISQKKKVADKKPKKVTKKGETISFSRSGAFILTALSRVKLHACRLNLDTGDVVKNAQLVPIALLLSNGVTRISVNFNGIVSLYIRMSVVPIQIVKEYLVFKLKL